MPRPSKPSKPSKPKRAEGSPSAAQPSRRRRASLTVRKLAGNQWELVHPRGARQRKEDLEEARRMVDAGELEIASDELRWLLNDCHDFLDAHLLLAEISLAEGDWQLARAHAGYAYDLGLAALPMHGKGTLPYRLPSNQGFHQAAKLLALCMAQLGQNDRAREIALHILSLDDSDPLSIRPWLAAQASSS